MRRLAAILAADVVGYARLMGRGEEAVHQRLGALRSEVIEPLVEKHHGRIVKLMGDGLLAEFGSIVDAVSCAVAWQDGVLAHEARGAGDDEIAFRIGVNLGDVIIDGSDIFGDGVNIAARLETIAPAHGVCISEDAWRQVRGKLDFDWAEMGPQKLKHVASPVVTFSLTRGTQHKAAAESAVEAVKPSVAVLPFANMSNDPEQDYFSDGITEDLITELSRFRELVVLSRNSSFAFRGQAVPVTDVAAKLGVTYVVEGSIRKAGNRLRITAQLIDARRDSHIWAERYDREMADIFEVQDDVVRRVASTLVGRLEHERSERSRRKSASELKAYDLYLQAREHFFNWSLEENRRAGELLDEAIALDPGYAAAFALLSEVRFRDWINGWSADASADLANSRRFAETAVQLDSDDSRTHTALAMAYLFAREPEQSRHHFETALRLNPNDPRVLVYYSRHAVLNGDPEHAAELCERAMQLNPFGKYNWNLGLVRFVARDYDEAARLLSNLANPTVTVLALLAASLAKAGRHADASQTTQRFLDLCKRTPMLKSIAGSDELRAFFDERWPFSRPDDTEHMMQAMREAGFEV